jgi:hypothetical protein
MQPPASLRITTIEAPLARARMFGCKAGAAPIQNVEKEREALLLFHLSPATRTNATRVSYNHMFLFINFFGGVFINT